MTAPPAITTDIGKVTVGMSLPDREFGPQTRTDIVRYQGASGDFNPVHHDDEFAQSAGMPGVFSVGMLQAGYLGTYCSDLFGVLSVRAIAVRFAAQVWPGDLLTCSGTVRALRKEAGAAFAELELVVTRAAGEVAVTGSATVELADLALDEQREGRSE